MMDITNLPGPSRFAVEPIAEIPIPSASTAMTCPVTTAIEKAQARKPHTKFDAGENTEKSCLDNIMLSRMTSLNIVIERLFTFYTPNG